MLVFKFIILVSLLAGSYCMSGECYALHISECNDQLQRPLREQMRLETTEDLRNLCSTIIPYGRCFGRVLERCVQAGNFHDNQQDLEEYQESFRFVESTCVEDSEIFQAIANNLVCVMSTMNSMEDVCHFRNVNVTYEEKISNFFSFEDYGCFMNTWLFYCVNAKFDFECGNDTRDAVAMILENMNYASPHCVKMRSDLLYLEAAFKSEFLQGRHEQAILPGMYEAIRKKHD